MDPVTVLLWAAVAIAAVVVVGAASGVWDVVRKSRADATAHTSTRLREAAEENERTARALANTAEHESQRARFEAIRRQVENGG